MSTEQLVMLKTTDLLVRLERTISPDYPKRRVGGWGRLAQKSRPGSEEENSHRANHPKEYLRPTAHPKEEGTTY